MSKLPKPEGVHCWLGHLQKDWQWDSDAVAWRTVCHCGEAIWRGKATIIQHKAFEADREKIKELKRRSEPK